MKKELWIIIGMVVLINFISAFNFPSTTTSSDLGTFKQNDCIELYQFCDDCSYVNVSSVKHPNSTIVYLNTLMTKTNQDFNYSYCNTSALGDYFYTVCGNKGGTFICENIDFKMTPNGEELSTGQSILYTLMTFLFFGFILMLFYFVIVMPNDNERDESGEIVKIIKLKYLRIFFIALLYPMIMVLLNLMNGLAVNFSTLSMFSGILGFWFEMMLRLSWVFTVLIIGWIVYRLIQDSNISKNIKRMGNFKI